MCWNWKCLERPLHILQSDHPFPLSCCTMHSQAGGPMMTPTRAATRAGAAAAGRHWRRCWPSAFARTSSPAMPSSTRPGPPTCAFQPLRRSATVLSSAASVEGAGEEDGKAKRKRGKAADKAGKVCLGAVCACFIVASAGAAGRKAACLSSQAPPFHQQTPVFDGVHHRT